MKKKGADVHKNNPSSRVVVILAILLVVVSLFSIVLVNNQVNMKINNLMLNRQKLNGEAQVTVTLLPTPEMESNVAIEVKPKP